MVTLRVFAELILALGAVLLLARDLRRTWRDRLRRPATLLVAALVAALLIGAISDPPHPSPWWLLLPGIVLGWEVARGWRQATRSHLWEAGVGAFAAGLVLGAVGLGLGGGKVAAALLGVAVLAAIAGAGLLRRSSLREPRPWRDGDLAHYERRSALRSGG